MVELIFQAENAYSLFKVHRLLLLAKIKGNKVFFGKLITFLGGQLTYRGPKYLFGKFSTSLTCRDSIQRTSRIFDIGFTKSK